MKTKLVYIALSLLTIAIVLFASPAYTQVACSSDLGWTNFSNPPQVNQDHIFCGEFKNSTPKGFHSRPNGRTPATVASLAVNQPANAEGIYGIKWSHVENPSQYKFSTMFPDKCTRAEVLNSIRYAQADRVPCPSGAPNWAWCGRNRPDRAPSAVKYCNAKNGKQFIIAGASLPNGDINTAFPLR